MKFCYACGRSTGGKPLFCIGCGRSYNAKLCPRLHVNPRWAEACSRCGSRNLSLPQPRVPILWRILTVITLVIIGLSILAVSTALIRFDRLQPEIRILIIAVLVAFGSTLPQTIRLAVWRLLKRRSNRLRA
jgi:hypothetical protein